MWALYAVSAVFLAAGSADWQDDFAKQPEWLRPALEVRYSDASRSAFEIAAEAYNLRGELRKPNRLLYSESENIMLFINVRDVHGTLYSSQNGKGDTRINLYRRGPYFSEVHWFDWEVADEKGNAAPIKGELTLYCYPDRLRASITWHATGRFALKSVSVMTGNNYTFAAEPMQTGDSQTFSFPLLGTEDPLPDSAFETINGVTPLRFDSQRGCYTIGSANAGGFQDHFYRHPNTYEQAAFTITNDETPRTVYICHETAEGPKGLVEGGVILDEDGHPLPLLVQISKNFGGEKEEPFYNPQDTPFSETWFPLHLEADESVTLTSLHLYQNWGRHPVKQFSSLGAWTDYFHSSTGVTETTCYVPFKFNALDGIDIADLRAMSQPTFWGNQPQHDNVAGHRLLRYKTSEGWQHLVYQRTRYLSTGPNWMRVIMEYVSSDGAMIASIESFEFPQQDELRSFFRLTCQLQQPISVADAGMDLRLLEIETKVQDLRYTHAAASNLDPVALSEAGVLVQGHPLPEMNAWMSLYGDPKGSNAIVLRDWLSVAPGLTLAPALTVERAEDGNTGMWIAPQAGPLDLPTGTTLRIDGFFLPYGDPNSAAPAIREARVFSEFAPRVTEVRIGMKENDFPVQIRATENVAEFTIEGGREVVPVIITGLSDYRWPRISRRGATGWDRIGHLAANPLDGVEVFAGDNGTFGVVFLVHTDNTPQTLRATAGQEWEQEAWIELASKQPAEGEALHGLSIKPEWLNVPLLLHFPVSFEADGIRYSEDPSDASAQTSAKLARIWKADPDVPAHWFEWDMSGHTVGGRVTPYEEDVEVQAWFENGGDKPVTVTSALRLDTADSMFDAARGARRWLLVDGQWKEWSGTEERAAAAAITSGDGSHGLALTWDQTAGLPVFTATDGLRAVPGWPACAPKRRAHLRGRLYMMKGSLEDLAARIRREFPATGG